MNEYKPIDKISKFCLSEHTNNLYKQEAGSSLALARDCADKINEVIEQFNELALNKWEKIHEQDGKIRKAILYMKDNLLNTINTLLNSKGEEMIDNAVKENLGVLQSQVNNLLGKVQSGSITSMDAEVIDGRLGDDGVTYSNIGTAIRTQFSYGNLWRTAPDTYDANDCLRIGHYYVGSGNEWKNVPTSAGLLITYNGNTSSRIYQMYHAYDGDIYVRNKKGSDFSEWKKIPNNEETLSLKGGTTGLQSCDLNNVLESGMYRLSSSFEYQNAPDKAGLLIVYGTASPNQYYQMFFSYQGALYTRCYVNNYMYEWKKIAIAENNIPSYDINDSKNYSIYKLDDTHLNIYKKGVNGYIKYQYGRQIDTSINLDIWRLLTIDLCDLNKNVVKSISTIGADLEGVVLLDGESDHVGGVHGDEKLVDYFLFVDGKQYTFENVPSMDCNEIRIVVNSTITHQDSTNICMQKNKQVRFDGNGININCKWKALEDLSIKSIRSCMFSIQKECFTHYYDSNIIVSPVEKSSSTTENRLSTDKNIIDMIYVGDVSAHHWSGRRGGSEENYSTIIQDYGARLKSYFNCYDNYQAKTNEILFAENNFFITC